MYCFYLCILVVVAVGGGGLLRCTSGGGPVLLVLVSHNIIWTRVGCKFRFYLCQCNCTVAASAVKRGGVHTASQQGMRCVLLLLCD